eukprot:GHVS01008908.1.p2 GENE.GHVS01008908.1~~GHVS01008908.1.p2  ORF type:complete len:295 (+),score=104.29 GHVS01008908.1:242-1126(+)
MFFLLLSLPMFFLLSSGLLLSKVSVFRRLLCLALFSSACSWTPPEQVSAFLAAVEELHVLGAKHRHPSAGQGDSPRRRRAVVVGDEATEEEGWMTRGGALLLGEEEDEEIQRQLRTAAPKRRTKESANRVAKDASRALQTQEKEGSDDGSMLLLLDGEGWTLGGGRAGRGWYFGTGEDTTTQDKQEHRQQQGEWGGMVVAGGSLSLSSLMDPTFQSIHSTSLSPPSLPFSSGSSVSHQLVPIRQQQQKQQQQQQQLKQQHKHQHKQQDKQQHKHQQQTQHKLHQQPQHSKQQHP